MRMIDADALFNDLKESVKAAREWKEEAQDEEIKIRAEQAHGTFVECALRVKNAPTIEAEPVRHGRWIPHGDDMWLCSNCKENIIFSMHESDRTEKQRYCCRCGARMDGGING